MINAPEILTWFESERDFYQGLEILSRYTSKFRLTSKLKKKGPSKNSHEKLTYELWKFTTLPEEVRYKEVDIKTSSAAPGTSSPQTSHTKQTKRDPKEIPQVIKDILTEYKDLYNKKTKAHKKLHEIPHDNLPGHMDQRRELAEQITEWSARMEILYPLKEDYFNNGIVPDTKEINGDNPDDSENKYKDLSDVKKVKKLNSFRTQLSKVKKAIIYKVDGPKKDELQKRINYYQEQITLLNSLVE
ncbi:MAG: hypothetical protein K8S00_12090 [Bacteroidales bacterium]|nr:hypothetical protein [Bacteroidales bacterium]